MVSEFFNMDYVLSFGIPVTGIVHVGGHNGEEADMYHAYGVEDVVWVEAFPEYAARMKAHVEQRGHIAVEALLADVDGEERDWWITSNEYASSTFEPDYHNVQNPHVSVTGKTTLVSKRFDTMWSEINPSGTYNFLVLDTQGSELLVLKGMGDTLDMFDLVCSEYSTVNFYKGGAQLKELDAFLHDFKRVYPDDPLIHADALYVRKD
jgi:FkbM family methyltransferase